MADLVLTNPFVKIGSTDYSAKVRKVTLPYGAEKLDNTQGGSGGTRVSIGGLLVWSAKIEFEQDFALAGFDQTIFALVGTSVAIEIRPTSAARSTSNPAYTGNGILTDYPILGQQIGQVVTSELTFEAAGALSRLTA